MKLFKDANGVEWSLSLNVTTIRAVRSALDIDLIALLDGGFEKFAGLVSDAVAMVDVLYVLCRDEARGRNVTDEDFGRAMHGDAIARARDAFTGALIDFFDDPRRRAAMTKVVEAARTLTDRRLDLMTEKLGALDLVSEAEKFMDSSGNGRESSASTPVPLRSEN